MKIRDMFVSYELAKELKEKGFNEPGLAYYFQGVFYLDDNLRTNSWFAIQPQKDRVTAPLYPQVVDWLREEHNVDIWIEKDYQNNRYFIQCPQLTDKGIKFNPWSDDYYQALHTAIEKALTLIEEKKESGGLIEGLNKKYSFKDLFEK